MDFRGMECELKIKIMVATLQSRKDALEAKLREKTLELKKLCIQEAELTGILPPETPIEPGESPPIFRRRVGTAFIYPEYMINKLKSKEEETVAQLEIDCKTQSRIAEAALALANELSASKSIRRKHRLEYQQSQRRLAELETRLNVLKQSIKSSHQLKQRKKPRPPLNIENDFYDGSELAPDDLTGHYNHMLDKPSTLPLRNRDSVLRNSHVYNSFGKSSTVMPPSFCQINQWNRNQGHRCSVEIPPHNFSCFDENANWLRNDNSWRNTAHVEYFSNQCYTTLPSEIIRNKSRYGSLDRRYRNLHQPVSGSPNTSSTQRNSPVVEVDDFSGTLNAVLLPNQTYPENSLTRTQSLGNVEHSRKALDTHSLPEKMQNENLCNTLGRRGREKEWRETSLDVECYEKTPPPPRHRETPPLHPRACRMMESSAVPQKSISMRTPPPLPPSHCTAPEPSPSHHPILCKSPVKSPILMETVPLESPKNHTVVEVGKWQPYREVTKPFEMSDFYKYSTKFRKSNEQGSRNSTCNEQKLPVNTENQTQIQEPEVTTGYYGSSIEDIYKNNLEPVYLDTEFMKNITQRRYRTQLVTTDRNENVTTGKQWCNNV